MNKQTLLRVIKNKHSKPQDTNIRGFDEDWDAVPVEHPRKRLLFGEESDLDKKMKQVVKDS